MAARTFHGFAVSSQTKDFKMSGTSQSLFPFLQMTTQLLAGPLLPCLLLPFLFFRRNKESGHFNMEEGRQCSINTFIQAMQKNIKDINA